MKFQAVEDPFGIHKEVTIRKEHKSSPENTSTDSDLKYPRLHGYGTAYVSFSGYIRRDSEKAKKYEGWQEEDSDEVSTAEAAAAKNAEIRQADRKQRRDKKKRKAKKNPESRKNRKRRQAEEDSSDTDYKTAPDGEESVALEKEPEEDSPWHDLLA